MHVFLQKQRVMHVSLGSDKPSLFLTCQTKYLSMISSMLSNYQERIISIFEILSIFNLVFDNKLFLKITLTQM